MSSECSGENNPDKETSADVNKKKRIVAVLCEHCKTSCKNKSQLKVHAKTCILRRTCKWCKIVFRNRGNLVTHEFHVHGDKSSKNDNQPVFVCEVCQNVFRDSQYLKYHIRRHHYNIQATTPLFELKKVNDVWFEEVLNSSVIAELRKISERTLLIQQCESDAKVQTEGSTEIVDLAHLYPIKQRTKKIKCDVCGILLLKRVYKKHFDEKHSDFTKHQCNYCKATFKRSYFFVRHVCNKPRMTRQRGVVISRVESMKSISV